MHSEQLENLEFIICLLLRIVKLLNFMDAQRPMNQLQFKWASFGVNRTPSKCKATCAHLTALWQHFDNHLLAFVGLSCRFATLSSSNQRCRNQVGDKQLTRQTYRIINHNLIQMIHRKAHNGDDIVSTEANTTRNTNIGVKQQCNT